MTSTANAVSVLKPAMTSIYRPRMLTPSSKWRISAVQPPVQRRRHAKLLLRANEERKEKHERPLNMKIQKQNAGRRVGARVWANVICELRNFVHVPCRRRGLCGALWLALQQL